MPSDVTREEFDQLAARTGFLEGEVEGEKLVVRHVLEQTRRNTEDLSALRSKVDGLDCKVDGLDRKVDGLDRKVDDLTRSLPQIVGQAVRDAIKPLIRKR